MTTSRLEAFSDGVIAILITIMVLELKVPHGTDLAALAPLGPVFFAYVLSFIYLGIYWNNHHHMLQVTDRVNGKILWANLHLLFWLSLIPFVSGWTGENHRASLPTAIYGAVLLLSGIAYTLLARSIMTDQGEGSKLKAAIGNDKKGIVSMFCYAASIPLAFIHPWIADAIFVGVAGMWLVPDPRIEHAIVDAGKKAAE
ncbi:MAG: TMEM175 family protein [Polyangiaceae bacterium]